MRTLISIFLLLISFSPVAQQEKENFDTFFYRFSSDKEFQISRIVFPLISIHWSEKNDQDIFEQTDTTYVVEQDWEHENFFLLEDYRPQIYSNFKEELADTDERLFCWHGVENGIDIKFFFKRKYGTWFLIKKEDLST
jgi:hypothetical protein